MARELELKYSSLEGRVPEGPELEAVFKGLGLHVGPGTARRQSDVYFDSPDLALERARLALRIRATTGGKVAAVKGRGDAAAGLFEREELEVALAPALPGGAPAWPAPITARLAGNVDLAALVPRLEIVTLREVFLLSRGGQPLAELAFDEVSCRPPSAGATDALIDEALFSEVEVEAVGGTSGDELRQVGAALAEFMPLVAGSVSKLERASALLAPFL
jgi:inorganic triphosphatase YgiF